MTQAVPYVDWNDACRHIADLEQRLAAATERAEVAERERDGLARVAAMRERERQTAQAENARLRDALQMVRAELDQCGEDGTEVAFSDGERALIISALTPGAASDQREDSEKATRNE